MEKRKEQREAKKQPTGRKSGIARHCPNEIYVYIFQYLDAASLLFVSQVCQQWRHIASDDSLWKRFFEEGKESVDGSILDRYVPPYLGARLTKAPYLSLKQSFLLRIADSKEENRKCKTKAVIGKKDKLSKIYSVDISADGQQIAAIGMGGKLMAWHLPSGKPILKYHLRSSWHMTVAYSPSSKVIAYGGLNNCITLYDRVKQREVLELTGHCGYISECVFVNEESILSASGDATCRWWDVNSASCVTAFGTLGANDSDVMSVSVAPDGQTFACGTCAKQVHIFDLRSGTCVRTFNGWSSDVNTVRYTPNGVGLAGAGDGEEGILFDVRKEDTPFFQWHVPCGVSSMAFASNGSILYSALYDGTVSCLSMRKKETLSPIKAHKLKCTRVVVSPNDGAYLATASWDGTVKLKALASLFLIANGQTSFFPR